MGSPKHSGSEGMSMQKAAKKNWPLRLIGAFAMLTKTNIVKIQATTVLIRG
jgi:hypothetical protein